MSNEKQAAAKLFKTLQAEASLTNAEAAELLSLNISSIKRKRNGDFPVWPAELRLMGWHAERQRHKTLLRKVVDECRQHAILDMKLPLTEKLLKELEEEMGS